jgi:hypothetical protein
MHKKYADKGLVAISLNLDSVWDDLDEKDVTEKVKADALKVLKEMGATFQNFLLAEPKVKVGEEEKQFWQAKFDIVGVPAVYVFDRQGRWYRFKSDDESLKHQDNPDKKTHRYPEVEALVQKLLAEK